SARGEMVPWQRTTSTSLSITVSRAGAELLPLRAIGESSASPPASRCSVTPVQGALPERLNARDTGWDDLRYLCHELLAIDGLIIRSDPEFGIAMEQEDWNHHHPGPTVIDQRLPCLQTEGHRIEKTTCPIRRDDFTLWPFPEDRVQVIWISI